MLYVLYIVHSRAIIGLIHVYNTTVTTSLLVVKDELVTDLDVSHDILKTAFGQHLRILGQSQ